MEKKFELKRCPLCGGEAKLVKGRTGILAIVCKCSSHIFYGGESNALVTAAKWNYRKSEEKHD